jgi:hypothetical protein
MGVTNYATLLGTKRNYDNSYENFIIRLDDPIEGKMLDVGTIKQIEIEENIFSLLPTIRIQLEDKGAYFAGYNIKNGDKIYFIVTPDITVKGADPEPYINTVFAVQSISCTPSLESSTYEYTIVGIFDAQSYLNEIAPYPKTTEDSILEQNRKNSNEAILEVLGDTSLKLVEQIKTDDKSLWLNCTRTRAQFIEKIVEHAWIAIDDAPLIYTDVDGNSHYSSIKTLAGKKQLCTFKNVKKYIDEKEIHKTTGLNYPFTSLDYLHAAGPILNQGGYKVVENYYTPYNLFSLENDDITFKDFDIYSMLTDMASRGEIDVTSIANAQMAEANTLGKFREAVYQQDTPYIASQSNKAPSQMDSQTRYVDAGVYFKEYHNHYDLAPLHNEMIRRSFFQNFVSMSVDVHRLPEQYRNNICRPVLGDKIYLDFSVTDSVDKIHSGNYIIAARKHCFKAFQSYTIEIISVTDGVFGSGILDEKKEKKE